MYVLFFVPRIATAPTVHTYNTGVLSL